MSTGSDGAYRWPGEQPTGPHATTWSVPGRPGGRQAVAPAMQLPPNGTKRESDAALGSMSTTHRTPGMRGIRGVNDADGVPEAPTRFPELETMSLNDLRTLHEERAKFEDFVSKHQYQKVVDDVVANVRTQVETLERHHRKQPTRHVAQYTEEEDVETVQKKVQELEQQVDDLQKTQDEWYAQHSPERLMERLRVGIAELEKTTETLEKNMLSSSMNFEDFLTRYIECRKKYHERCLKLEQLKHESRHNIPFGR